LHEAERPSHYQRSSVLGRSAHASRLDVVLPYVHERKQFGSDWDVPVGAGQARRYVRHNECGESLRLRRRQGMRPRPERPEDAAGAILYAAERATQVALDAIQTLGGSGYTNDYPLGRCCATPSLRDRRGTAKSAYADRTELFEKSAELRSRYVRMDRHCEERSDEAIQRTWAALRSLDCSP